MADFLQATTRFLRALVRRDDTAAPWAGEPARVTGNEALLALESRVADAVWHPAAPGTSLAVNDFGRRPTLRRARTVAQALSAAEGIALSGARTATFLPAGSLEALHAQLASAASSHVPLVAHHVFADRSRGGTTPEVGHRPYHRVADTGALLVLPRDAQSAVDLTLVARRVAELGLVPALVAVDGPALGWAVASLRLPEAELVREYLGEPQELIECPTPAQALLFGQERRRVPAWFDPDRPVAHGVPLLGADLDGALAARQRFFSDHLAALVREASDALTSLTGREVPAVTTHQLAAAKVVVVAQGSTVGLAETLADRLRLTEKLRVGVVGVQWLRPFPAADIREVLAKAHNVVVLERVESPGPEAPLLSEIRAALGEEDLPRMVSATWGASADVPPAGDLAELLRRAARGAAPAAVRLGLSSITDPSGHPKRQAWLDRVEREYPHVEDGVIHGEALSLVPDGARTVAVYSARGDVPAGGIVSFTDALFETVGESVHTRVRSPEGDLWIGRVTADERDFGVVGDDSPADVVVLASEILPDPVDPFAAAKEGGAAVIPLRGDAMRSWVSLAERWRETILRRRLRVFAVGGDWAALARVAAAVAAGQEAGDGVEELTDLESPKGDRARPVPLAVRRFGDLGRGHHSVPRFWGEVAAPRLDGELAEPTADPHLALAAVPPATATFHDASRGRERVPVIDMDACTGCAKCWTGCPDAAIGPVALGTQAVLDAAEERATGGSRSAVAGKLARAHKQLATKLDGLIAAAGDGTVPDSVWDEGLEWLLEKMKVEDEEREEMRAAFDETREEATSLALGVTDVFFREPHAAKKGSGALLALAVDPRACQACGGCAQVCPEDAIEMVPATDERVEAMRDRWASWERWPDTPGDVVAAAAEHPHVGPLGALLLSRHCLMATVAGEGAEPGSGARLATRLLTATSEYRLQRLLQSRIDDLDQAVEGLRGKLRESVADSVSLDDLGSFEGAAANVPARAKNLGELVRGLEGSGASPGVDAKGVYQAASTGAALQRLRRDLAEGDAGNGRARYGLVLAGEGLTSWAARYPRNPFSVPVAVDASGDGSDLATGLLEGLLVRATNEARLRRAADLLVKAPSDLPAALRRLDELEHRDLSAEELEQATPVMLLVSSDALDAEGLAGIGRALSGELPVKVVLLDERELPLEGGDATHLALSHRRAYVASTSVAHADHFFTSITAALAHPGPAFVHVHTPSPRRHGYDTAHTRVRAERAVAARVHPLLRYDPHAEGVFGSRIDLSGNPDVSAILFRDDEGRAVTPAHWALEERRYAAQLTAVPEGVQTVPVEQWVELPAAERGAQVPVIDGPDGPLAVGAQLARVTLERLESWRTLQELAGVVTPFTERVRAETEKELGDKHAAELEQARLDKQAAVAEVEQRQQSEQAARLRDRLMQLAGFDGSGPPRGGNGT